MNRQIVLDTETTGLETEQDHRIIEIGYVEIVNRRLTGKHLHLYINPARAIDEAAQAVHGITREFLADKPPFADIADAFLRFVRDAELIIHNADFDIGFLDHELKKLDPEHPGMRRLCQVTDSLALARNQHPGQRNTLDALCKRYHVDNSQRELHGALLDAEILADVYLAMTGGQVGLGLDDSLGMDAESATAIRRLATDRPPLPIIAVGDQERSEHEAYLDRLDQAVGGACVWRRPIASA